MDFLLLRLEGFGLTREIWSYLTVKDIIQLLKVSEDIRGLSIRINKLVPQSIEIRKLKRLSSEECKKLILKNISETFPNIYKLNLLSGEYLGNTQYYHMDKSLVQLFESDSIIQNLKELTVPVKNDESLVGIENLKNLHYLKLSNSEKITLTSLIKISRLISLETLDLSMCKDQFITYSAQSYLSSLTNLTSLKMSPGFVRTNEIVCLPKFKKLKELSLSGCDNLSNNCLSHLSSLSSLTSLDISHCSDFDHNGFVHLSSLTNLFSLNISNLFHPFWMMVDMNFLGENPVEIPLIDNALSHITSLVNLRSLDLAESNITNTGMLHLTSFTNLTSLNLCHCTITDQGLFYLSTLTTMQSLNLTSYPDVNDSNLTDVGYLQISSLINLTSLNLTSCCMLRNFSFISVLTRITSLCLSNCIHLNDQELSNVSTCTNLTSLDLSECKLITDQGLSHLVSLTKINNLSLFRCEKITDVGFSQLLTLINIETLNLESCYEITDRTVFNISVTFMKLAKISLPNHTAINIGFNHLKKRIPPVRINLR